MPHHQWRIQDFSEGGASGQTRYEKGNGGGGGGGGGREDFSPQIFALELLMSLIINCKARAIQ